MSEVIFEEEREQQTLKMKLKKIPFITIGLILVNIIVFGIMEYGGDTEDPVYMLQHGAAFGKMIFDEGQYYRLFTSMFMHFGLGHLVNNMLALAIMGSTLERLIGRIYFIVFYILSGLLSGLVSAMVHYNSETLTICAGASGAIYGVLGGIMIFAVLAIRNKDKTVYLRIILVILLMLEGHKDNVDVAAHIGGFLSGIVLMFILFFVNKYKIQKLKKIE